MIDKIRLKTVLTEFNISLKRVVDLLHSKNIKIENNPNIRINKNIYQILIKEFKNDKEIRSASEKIYLQKRKEKEEIREELLKHKESKKQDKYFDSEIIRAKADQLIGPKTFGKIDLEIFNKKINYVNKELKEKKDNNKYKKNINLFNKKDNIKDNITKNNPFLFEKVKEKSTNKEKPVHIKTQYQKLSGLMFTGDKVDLTQFEKKRNISLDDKKKKRKRIKKDISIDNVKNKNQKIINSKNIFKKQFVKNKLVDKDKNKIDLKNSDTIEKQIKETLEKLTLKNSKSKASKFRREKRQSRKEKIATQKVTDKNKVLKIAEFATVSDISSIMEIPENKIILTCISLGIMATMNQRLDAETISLIAYEFGYNVEFIGALQEISEEKDLEKDLEPRPPIITIMGHVDHGKTSLIDYIRNTNIISKESGGITQHIGAYSVNIKDNKYITILDTPGHEAFTAMRARGAKITDIAIIVISADDEVMPQTKEAINHAKLAGVPMIFAINKMDKDTAQPEKIRKQLANINILLEEWGGKYQSQEISAKTGFGINELLEKILLEADILELKANPKKLALGVVIEATLDKGRGYITTVLVQGGTLKLGDYVLAGIFHGKVKALLDERGKNILTAKPSKSVIILGLSGAPAAGDKFKVFKDEKEAKKIASYREQLQREQNIRSQKHLTLDEIGRRIALGDFKELKIVLKGDVDGSVEALSDALYNLSTDSIVINIIHKNIGQITESDVLLAGASDAIIIGFNVRPANNAKNIADKENIEIRTYSIIYDVINDIKEAIDGLLSPDIKEKINGIAEVREIFKIPKIGNIAGCMVISGKLIRNSKIRVIREGVVVYNSELESLRRFKEDVKEVSKGYECGISVKNYNNLKSLDVIESYKEILVK